MIAFDSVDRRHVTSAARPYRAGECGAIEALGTTAMREVERSAAEATYADHEAPASTLHQDVSNNVMSLGAAPSQSRDRWR